MAVTVYAVNADEAVKLWSKRLTVEALKETQAQKFMGTNSSSVIQIRNETSKSAGDKVTFTLRMQLSGLGVIGDGALEGNEESLVTHTDSVTINQLRNAVRSGGRMTQQRVPFSIRDEAHSGLRDWWADRIDTAFFNQICGNTAEAAYVADNGNTQNTGLTAPIAPDSDHYKTAHGSGHDEDMTSTDKFSLTLIDKAVEAAKTLSPAIRPVQAGGKARYVAFLHPYQVTDMRTNTNDGQWLDFQKAAMTGGEVDDNPIFTGALGIYNNVVLHEDSRVATGCNSSTSSTGVSTVRRAVLCGAQAATMAFGQANGPSRMTWVEKLFDYENQLGVSSSSIYALKKTVFNSADFATVVMSSYAAAH